MKLDVNTARTLGLIGKIDVFLDDKMIKHVVFADEESGVVCVQDMTWVYTDEYRYIFGIPTIQHRGNVDIRLRDDQ